MSHIRQTIAISPGAGDSCVIGPVNGIEWIFVLKNLEVSIDIENEIDRIWKVSDECGE